MSYIGNAVPANFQSRPSVVRFNGDASDTTFALGREISSVQDIIVSVDGVVQDTAGYTVPDGSTLTFSAAPSSGTGNIFVFFLDLAGANILLPQSLRVTLEVVDYSEQMLLILQ